MKIMQNRYQWTKVIKTIACPYIYHETNITSYLFLMNGSYGSKQS
jgi:hypothetical protein